MALHFSITQLLIHLGEGYFVCSQSTSSKFPIERKKGQDIVKFHVLAYVLLFNYSVSNSDFSL